MLGALAQLGLPAVFTEDFEYDGFDFIADFDGALAPDLVRTTLDFDLLLDGLAFCAEAGTLAPSTNKAAKAVTRVL